MLKSSETMKVFFGPQLALKLLAMYSAASAQQVVSSRLIRAGNMRLVGCTKTGCWLGRWGRRSFGSLVVVTSFSGGAWTWKWMVRPARNKDWLVACERQQGIMWSWVTNEATPTSCCRSSLDNWWWQMKLRHFVHACLHIYNKGS